MILSKIARPCQQCVKRDFAASCTDGVRKRAKYLHDAIDSQQQAAEQESCSGHVEESPLNDAHALFSFPNAPSSTSSSSSTFSSLTSAAATPTFIPLSAASVNNSTSSTTNTAAAVLSHGFGSDAINLEYTILSTMLSSPTAELQSLTSELSMVENWQRQGAIEALANSLQQQHQQQAHSQRTTLAQHLQQQQQQRQQQQQQQHQHQHQQHQQPLQQDSSSSNGVSPPTSNRVSKRKFPSNTPENVYANTKQPFNYTEGFHYLLQYVRE
ncbi:hypothetical protein BGZ65_009998, partial [Modicella reniformis]